MPFLLPPTGQTQLGCNLIYIPTMFTKEVNKIPTIEQASPYLTEQKNNVALYQWLATQNPEVEYEDGNTKLWFLTPPNYFAVLAFVNDKEKLPVRCLCFNLKPSTFLTYPSCNGLSVAWVDSNSTSFLDGDFFEYGMRLLLDRFSILSLTAPSTKSMYDQVINKTANTLNYNYIYMTTENGTRRILHESDLVFSEILGTDPIFIKRFVSISKNELKINANNSI